jgi:hypothetical protein
VDCVGCSAAVAQLGSCTPRGGSMAFRSPTPRLDKARTGVTPPASSGKSIALKRVMSTPPKRSDGARLHATFNRSTRSSGSAAKRNGPAEVRTPASLPKERRHMQPERKKWVIWPTAA